MKITTNSNGYLSSVDRISAAIIYGASATGFGQQIMNHSWTTSANAALDPYKRKYEDFGLLMDAVRQAYNNGVITVAGAGNGPATVGQENYPANAKDNWVINVGGSAMDLLTGDAVPWDDSSTNILNQTTASPLVDVAAPASNLLVASLSSVSTGTPPGPPNNSYVSFGGTSAAAPHVSGVAALMLSAYKQDHGSTATLRPEDVEHILEATAGDISPSGRDNYTGAGLVNASSAVACVKYRKIGYDITAVTRRVAGARLRRAAYWVRACGSGANGWRSGLATAPYPSHRLEARRQRVTDARQQPAA